LFNDVEDSDTEPDQSVNGSPEEYYGANYTGMTTGIGSFGYMAPE
jgi:hypothetical protein